MDWYSNDSQIAVHDDIPLERFALATFYYSFQGENWIENTNWLNHNKSICDWFSKEAPTSSICEVPGSGMFQLLQQVDRRKYKRLVLPTNGLIGQLPREIELLQHLEILDLTENNFERGTIPSQLGSLRLVQLKLKSNGKANGFIGRTPSELGLLSHVEEINFCNNSLEGTIPSELGLLPNVEILHFYNNDLTGTIPSELGLLPKLEIFDFSSNRLAGAIPSQLGQLSASLKFLLLSWNQLEGTIPVELGSLRKLEDLTLTENNLSSAIPSQLGLLSNLKILYINDNRYLQGTIPATLGSLKLSALSLEGTNLSCPIPSDVCWPFPLYVRCEKGEQSRYNCEKCNCMAGDKTM